MDTLGGKVVLVGDVVESRRFHHERALVDGLAGAVSHVNAAVDPDHPPLRLVVRDEFHGVFDDLHTALESALRLRLATDDIVLATDAGDAPVDVRVGLGLGDVITGDDGTPAGAAWWHAHEARGEAQALASRSGWPPSLRTVLHGDDAPLVAAVNAYLLLQDQLLARMDHRDRRALRGLLDGERQVDIGAALGITQPAVARRVKDRGALAIRQALDHVRRVYDPPDEPGVDGIRPVRASR